MKAAKVCSAPFVLTKLDVKILSFMSFWRCCEVSHLRQILDVSTGVLNNRLKYLQKIEFLITESLFVGRSPTLKLTDQGAKQMGVKSIKPLSLSDYFHEMTVVDVALGFYKKYPEAIWASSRGDYGWGGGYFSHKKPIHVSQREGGTKSFQIPDGYLYFPNNRCIAIEVELTLKNKRRREEIFKNYAISLDIDEVWYFCKPEVERVLKRESEDYPFVSIFPLLEMASWPQEGKTPGTTGACYE